MRLFVQAEICEHGDGHVLEKEELVAQLEMYVIPGMLRDRQRYALDHGYLLGRSKGSYQAMYNNNPSNSARLLSERINTAWLISCLTIRAMLSCRCTSLWHATIMMAM